VGAIGTRIVEVHDLDGCRAVDDLFAAVWGLPAGAQFTPPPLLMVMAHAGNYLVAAYDDDHGGGGDRMVAASMAFLGMKDRQPILHSHITGVVPDLQGRAIGFALKQHQRAWCLARGIATVEWTFDPLVRRNGYFNLEKLGAAITAYYTDFYGAMHDGINQGDDSDRCLVRWDLTLARARVDPAVLDQAEVILSDEGGRPSALAAPGRAAVELAYVPEDIVALRETDPGAARAWRTALRDTMGAAVAAGYHATAMTKDGAYVLTREAHSG
jgi:predicted GNAT superfamily acetyltransferase